MTAESEQQRFAPESFVWVADEKDAWVEAIVVKQEGESVTLKTVSDNGQIVVKASECFAKEDEGKGVDDMTKMSYLHEPGVLQNLYTRFKLNQIYTYTGSILIAVNPFVRLPGLYDSIMKSQYQGARLGDLAPHVFAIADTAYRAMIEEKRSQSVLISGESGAGKTETTKLVMEYLAGVGGRTSTEKSNTNIESQVLESNPILEAFGNAKTVRNNNSSRFGKFIEIQFDKKGRVSGAAIKSYLLERSRVVQIKDPERNYHCFYQLCYGASPEEVIKYMLPGSSSQRAQTFHYLNQSQCFELSGKESNAEEYQSTRRAMDVLGFTAEQQSSVFAIVAAILHLGNVKFLQKGVGDPLDIQPGAAETHLKCVADLLLVDRDALAESLTTITRKVAGETLKSPLDAKKAASTRDSLAKNLYSTMFDWIVAKINESIGVDHSAEAFIGVLDIYGFEHFEVNSFEQFCINLANEKLQQHFNQHVLKMEQEEYEKEEINWSRIPFADNQDVLDVIEKEQGILSLLDSACKMSSTTPESFNLSLLRKFQNHVRFSKSKFSKLDFILEHYAGKVKYSSNEFLTKNIDAVVPEHHALLCNSKDPFIAALFPKEKAASKQNKFVSLGNSFKLQLGDLMKTLNRTEPHYIRCVKPNSKLKPQLLEKPLVMSQLRSGGVLEAVRMCSAGYPTRKTFEEFVDRFALLAPLDIDPLGDDTDNVKKILAKTGLEGYQIGLTKVFLRAGQMVILETMRLEKMNAAAEVIQRGMRLFLFMTHRKKACLLLQTAWRGYKAVKGYKHVRLIWAATVAQKHARASIQRTKYQAQRTAAIILQTAWRCSVARLNFVNFAENSAATVIQRIWRGYKSRKPLSELRRFVRGRMARKQLAKLKKDAALQSDLLHRATEADKRAALATSQALQGSLRYMVIQKLKEKSDRTRKEALAQLAQAQKEIEKLQAELASRDVERAEMETALLEAQAEAAMARNFAEQAAYEKSLLPAPIPAQHTPAQPEVVPRVLEPVPIPAPVHEEVPEPQEVAQVPAKEAEPSKNKVPRVLPAEDASRKVQAAEAAEKALQGLESVFEELPPLNVSRRSMSRSFSVVSSRAATPLATPVNRTFSVRSPIGRTPSANAEALNKLAVIASLHTEQETSRKLRAEAAALREEKEGLEARLEDAAAELEASRQALARVQEVLDLREMELKEFEGRVFLLQDKLSGKDRLEQEVKMLRNKLLLLIAEDKPQLPLNKQQEILLREVGAGNNLGFSHGGYPVAAVLIYKCFAHWKTFETEKTNTFDRVIEAFQIAERDGTISELAYWMTNTVWLFFLVQEHKVAPPAQPQYSFSLFGSPQKQQQEPAENADTTVFKIQLGTSVERLYITVRDSIVEELKMLLSGPPNHGSMPRSGTLGRKSAVTGYWTSIRIVLSQAVDTLQANNVPPLIVQALLKQLLSFVNVKIFNSIMVRSHWCPCTLSNGELMSAGLQNLLVWVEDVQYWLADALGRHVEPVAQELCHVAQAVQFLIYERKPQRSMEEFLNLCPDLSINQLVHMCIWYEDDKYRTDGVSKAVIDRMWTLMLDDSPMLLKVDDSVPFTVDDVLSTLASFDLNEVEPPTSLVQDASFIFLLPQTASLSARLLSTRSPLWDVPAFGLLKSISPNNSRRIDSELNISKRRSYDSQ